MIPIEKTPRKGSWTHLCEENLARLPFLGDWVDLE